MTCPAALASTAAGQFTDQFQLSDPPRRDPDMIAAPTHRPRGDHVRCAFRIEAVHRRPVEAFAVRPLRIGIRPPYRSPVRGGRPPVGRFRLTCGACDGSVAGLCLDGIEVTDGEPVVLPLLLDDRVQARADGFRVLRVVRVLARAGQILRLGSS